MTQAASVHERLAREIAHFNLYYEQEAARGVEGSSGFDKQRYAAPPTNTIFPREYFYHLLAPLKDKDTLEIACGNGNDATICAYNGLISTHTI